MERYELLTFPSPAELAKAAAGRAVAMLEARSQERPAFGIALSGGRIAGALFSALAARLTTQLLAKVHFFWADERCVSPTDPESNFRLANEILFGPLEVAAGCIHRVRGEEDPLTAAAVAEAELRSVLGAAPGRPPLLDLVLLGMGADGHTASLFPDEPDELIEDNAVYRPVTARKPPPRRITMGYGAIIAAREVWVLISGPGKAAVLRRSLDAPAQTPLGRVINRRRRTLVFVDDTALA